jgi:hypothetical protein
MLKSVKSRAPSHILSTVLIEAFASQICLGMSSVGHRSSYPNLKAISIGSQRSDTMLPSLRVKAVDRQILSRPSRPAAGRSRPNPPATLPQTHRARNKAMNAMLESNRHCICRHTSRKTLSDIQTQVEICEMVRCLLIRTPYIVV